MKEADRLFIGHMLDAAREAIAKTAGKTRAEFDADPNLPAATLYRLQTIGEAARHLPDDLIEAHPEIPWHKITGTRHRLVHDYMQVDFDIVWRIVTEHLPKLVPQLENLLRQPPR